MQHYTYRTTADKLHQHADEIAEAGDTVVTAQCVGGRDWMILARKGEPTVTDLTARQLEDVIAAAVERGIRNGGHARPLSAQSVGR